MAVALRVAFDGAAFSGSQRQPDARTVDGDLLAALHAIGAGPRGFRPASRTDAGVSARGYAVCVETSFPASALARAVTGNLEDAWCTAWAPVPDGYDPRRAALGRTYQYFLPAQGLDAAAFGKALELFVGEHDFSAFARVEAHRSPRRTVRRVEVRAEGGVLAVEVEGASFLWNQVRRMIAAAQRVATGEAGLEEVREALRKGRGRDLGLAPAEGLVLAEVDLGLSWTADPWAERAAGAALARARTDARLRDLVLSAVGAISGPLTGSPHRE